MTLPTLDAALRGALCLQLVLLAAMLWRDRRHSLGARTAIVLCAGLVVQVVSSAPSFERQVPGVWQAPFVAVSVGNAVLFWLLVKALFDDGFVPRPVHRAAWWAVVLLGGANCLLGPDRESALGAAMTALQRAVPLVCAALAVVEASSSWRDDLVEGRRRLRAWILAGGVGYTVAMLLVRAASPRGLLSETTAAVDLAMLLALVVPASWALLRVADADVFPSDRRRQAGESSIGPSIGPARGPAALIVPSATLDPRSATPAAATFDSVGRVSVARSTGPSADPPAIRGPSSPPGVVPPLESATDLPSTDAADERIAQALHRAMADERAYRTESLTVAALAARLGTPEYRLRAVINGRLGHRHFNAYLNGFRLAEARAALADPARRDVPVLTIALDAGFGSIGPFNRAFKAETGLTPTAFRQAMLADSTNRPAG